VSVSPDTASSRLNVLATTTQSEASVLASIALEICVMLTHSPSAARIASPRSLLRPAAKINTKKQLPASNSPSPAPASPPPVVVRSAGRVLGKVEKMSPPFSACDDTPWSTSTLGTEGQEAVRHMRCVRVQHDGVQGAGTTGRTGALGGRNAACLRPSWRSWPACRLFRNQVPRSPAGERKSCDRDRKLHEEPKSCEPALAPQPAQG
jgi:hypothetical protein